ncbi:MAG: hypothetical protein ABEH86_13570 [Haloarcula sp.]
MLLTDTESLERLGDVLARVQRPRGDHAMSIVLLRKRSPRFSMFRNR